MTAGETGPSPRVRGTPLPIVERGLETDGPSPRVRGTPLVTERPQHLITVHPRVCGEHFLSTKLQAHGAGPSPRVRGTRSQKHAMMVATSVHPRVCGEHGFSASQILNHGGPSPRVRGTHQAVVNGLEEVRSIPACAGNTALPLLVVKLRTVHPRVCGEHFGARFRREGGMRSIPACAGNTLVYRISWETISGPSPRVRGTLISAVLAWSLVPVHPRVCGEHHTHFCIPGHGTRSIPACAGNTLQALAVLQALARSIPACAGNTCRNHPARPELQVHPRVCGEHDPVHLGHDRHRRSIPACAGNTLTRASAWWMVSVHPRVCGEHLNLISCLKAKYGPSPRVRGTPGIRDRRCPCCRSIPACAGNTPGTTTRTTQGSVHPRVCGEHGQKNGLIGTGQRSIPACAGNTPAAWGPSRWPSVHPRVCGEHAERTTGLRRKTRSIPACAGNTPAPASSVAAARSIPACAGNTLIHNQTGQG